MTPFVPLPVSYKSVSVANTTLFAVAAQYMNDATRWNEIAAINGLRDPWISAQTTLKVPSPQGKGNGGVLGL